MSWTIGADVGGTFIDFYAHNQNTEEVKLHKLPSTRSNPGQGVLRDIDHLTEQGVTPDLIRSRSAVVIPSRFPASVSAPLTQPRNMSIPPPILGQSI